MCCHTKINLIPALNMNCEKSWHGWHMATLSNKPFSFVRFIFCMEWPRKWHEKFQMCTCLLGSQNSSRKLRLSFLLLMLISFFSVQWFFLCRGTYSIARLHRSQNGWSCRLRPPEGSFARFCKGVLHFKQVGGVQEDACGDFRRQPRLRKNYCSRDIFWLVA